MISFVFKGVAAETIRYNVNFNLITLLKLQGQPPTVRGDPVRIWSKNNIIDGKVGFADNCSCCSAFEPMDNTHSWVELDFQQTYRISKIIVYGRLQTDKPEERVSEIDLNI